jgi:hypothetical protein
MMLPFSLAKVGEAAVVAAALEVEKVQALEAVKVQALHPPAVVARQGHLASQLLEKAH